jgi:L-aspartate oxidase
MWADVGLIREASGLAAAVADIGTASARLEQNPADRRDLATWRSASIALVGWLIARAALRRTESRGGHRRRDFPERDDVHWSIHIGDTTGRAS